MRPHRIFEDELCYYVEFHAVFSGSSLLQSIVEMVSGRCFVYRKMLAIAPLQVPYTLYKYTIIYVYTVYIHISV